MAEVDNAPRRKRWCCLIKLASLPDIPRVREIGGAVATLIKRWSGGESETLCVSEKGDLFGFMFIGHLPTDMMLTEFQKLSASRNGDAILFLEVGEDFSTAGFSRVGTWLQHHHAK